MNAKKITFYYVSHIALAPAATMLRPQNLGHALQQS